MAAIIRDWPIRLKWLLVGVSIVLVTVGVSSAVSLWGLNDLTTEARNNVLQLTESDLDHVTRGVMQLIEAENQALLNAVAARIHVAQSNLADAGGITFGSQTRDWSAVNQFTKVEGPVTLPVVALGTGTTSPEQWVENVASSTGSAVTIFQRMNAQGDMLRVATTVRDENGQPAIGTYIPAVMADGSANPVLAQVLQGKPYSGSAYVVKAWYITAYEPLTDSGGNVVGMLFVGIPRDENMTLRKALADLKVGQTGYVYVLGSSGAEQGVYIISKDGKRDGENVWETQDADGAPVIQTIIKTAVALNPGEFGTVRYRWQNAGEASPRWKIARVAYYAPYNWVIGVGAYEDEFFGVEQQLQAHREQLTYILIGVGLLLAVLAAGLTWISAGAIAGPLVQMTTVARALATGDVDHHIADLGHDEVGQLAESFRTMIAYMRNMADTADRISVGDLRVAVSPKSERDLLGHAFAEMTRNLRALVGQVADNAADLTASASRLTTTAGQAGQAASQIAFTIQQIAGGLSQQTAAVTQTAASVEQMKRAIDGVAAGAREQAEAVDRSSAVTRSLDAAIQQVGDNARAVTEDSVQAAEAAQTGAKTVAETVSGMQAIQVKVGTSATRVREMGHQSDQIGAIVETIEDIASQTNLLALNAAIEAARAGEHGKGFAVVADEVRKLAERASQATREIGSLIVGMQSTVAEAVRAMDDGTQEVESGAAHANQAGTALNAILQAAQSVNGQATASLEASRQMNDLSAQLVTATQAVRSVVQNNVSATANMAAGSVEVMQAIDSIASVSEENSAATEEVSASATEVSHKVDEVKDAAVSLTQLADNLLKVVARFKSDPVSAPVGPTRP